MPRKEETCHTFSKQQNYVLKVTTVQSTFIFSLGAWGLKEWMLMFQVMHYLDTLRPQELVAQMLAASYLLVADGLKTSLSSYRVPLPLAQQLEELCASMASLLPSLYIPSKLLYLSLPFIQ